MDRRDAESAGFELMEPNADSVETVLQLSIDLHGPALLGQPEKLRRHLEERCPDAASDISLLLIALEEQVPQTLLRVQSSAELQRLIPRLEARLLDRREVNPFASSWAVATWANVLRMDSAPLATSVEVLHDEPVDTSTAERDAVSDEIGPPVVAAAPEPIVAAAPVAGPATNPVADPADKPEAASTTTAALAPEPEPEPLQESEPEAPSAPLSAPSSGREPDREVAAMAAASDRSAFVADVPRETERRPTLEAQARPETVAVAGRSFNPWLGIGGAVLALLVLIVATRLPTGQNKTEPATQPIAQPNAPAPQPAPVASTVVAAPTTAVAVPRITGVTSDEPVIGDGTEHEVFVSIEPTGDEVRRVETQFIGGDGNWESRPRAKEIRASTGDGRRIAAGTIGLRTTRPATATFQYVLTMADGRRSAPFVKQFVFTPIAARPPAIVAITAPASIVAGKPVTLTIGFREGDGQLASVERKAVAEGRASAATSAARSTPVATLASPAAGTLRYPLPAIDASSRSTLEFTLVDRDGLRSEPKRVVLEAAAAPKRDGPVACTRETCGSVVAVREAAGPVVAGRPAPHPTNTHEVIVRLDDRTIHTFALPGRWKTGARVRLIGGRLAAVEGRDGRDLRSPPRRLAPESVPFVDQ